MLGGRNIGIYTIIYRSSLVLVNKGGGGCDGSVKNQEGTTSVLLLDVREVVEEVAVLNIPILTTEGGGGQGASSEY